jgi:hypothetical protein
MANDQDKQSYEIGYCRPPKKSQFVKGRSGNAKGRPKGSQNISSIVSKMANERITITINGRQKRVTKAQAAAMQLANKSASGDPKATSELFRLIGQGEEKAQKAPPELTLESQEELLQDVLQTMREVSNSSLAASGPIAVADVRERELEAQQEKEAKQNAKANIPWFRRS